MSNFEQEINNLKQDIASNTKRIKELEKIVSSKDMSPIKKSIPPSIVEFLKDKNPERRVDLVLMCAYYHCIQQDNKSFSAQDLKKLFKDAHEILPSNSNLNSPITQNQSRKRPYFAEYEPKNDDDGILKRWYITQSGIEAVEKFSSRDENNQKRGT